VRAERRVCMYVCALYTQGKNMAVS